MSQISIRQGVDRLGMVLSALCAVHCVLGVALIAVIGAGGHFLLDPAIHRIGLALAIVLAGAAIGSGAIRHRQTGPLLTAIAGLCLMGVALLVGHGVAEAILTVFGVGLVGLGHILNMRHCCTHP